MIRLRLLGSVDLKGSNGEELRSIIAQPKPMALLAYLAAATPVGYRRREELLSVFWPELDSARGRRALSQALHVLRSDLDEGTISSRGVEELGIDRTIVSSDVDDFRAAIDRSDWAAASDMYRGELLSGFLISGSPEFDQWLDKERARLKSQAIDAAWHLSSSAADAKTAHRWARRAVELDPYSEDGIRRLLELLDKTGNRAEAIRAYDEFRERVARDLESEPSKETRALADSLKESPVPRSKPAARRDPQVAAPIAEPESRVESHVEQVSPPPQRSRLPFLVGVPLVLVVIAAALVFAKQRSGSRDASAAPAPSRVVIAEFESAPGDTALGRTITEALRLDLSRSHLVKVMSDAALRDALVLMKRDTMLQVTNDLARDVAIRENVPAILAGDVRRAGNGFVLSARLVNANNGDLLGGWRATATDSADLLKAIDQLSSSLRQDAGESVRAIKASSPLLRVSTTSVAALRKEAMAMDAFYAEDYRRATALLYEAVDEDSTFTDAYQMLSVILYNAWTHPSQSIDAAIKAYRYRDKLRDAERYNVDFQYLSAWKGDIDVAIDVATNAAALDPQIVFWGRYSGLLMQQRRIREGELAALQGMQWDANPFLYAFLSIARFRGGKPDEARRTLADGLRGFPASPILLGLRVEMTSALGQYARADSLAHFPGMDLGLAASLDAITGKVGEARQHLVDLRQSSESQSRWYSAVNTWVALARLELDAAHDTARATAIADSIKFTKEWNALYPNERQYASLAHFYVLAGKTDRAKSLLDEAERNVPQDYRAHDKWITRRTRAMIRVAGGDASQVDEVAAAVQNDPVPTSALADLVWCYRRLGRMGDAAKAAQAYLDERYPRRTEDDAFNLATMRQLAAMRQ